VLGDFNSTRYTDEKVGGNQLSFANLASFNNFIDHCSLLDIRCLGNKWSWHNSSLSTNRILGRRDRVLCNQNWIALFPDSFYKYQSFASTDHAPITLHLLSDKDAGPKPFRFFHYWMQLPEFPSTLKKAWNMGISGDPLYQLARRLKNVKHELKLWLKEDNVLPKTRIH